VSRSLVSSPCSSSTFPQPYFPTAHFCPQSHFSPPLYTTKPSPSWPKTQLPHLNPFRSNPCLLPSSLPLAPPCSSCLPPHTHSTQSLRSHIHIHIHIHIHVPERNVPATVANRKTEKVFFLVRWFVSSSSGSSWSVLS
jgi:hypothetical protein